MSKHPSQNVSWYPPPSKTVTKKLGDFIGLKLEEPQVANEQYRLYALHTKGRYLIARHDNDEVLHEIGIAVFKLLNAKPLYTFAKPKR